MGHKGHGKPKTPRPPHPPNIFINVREANAMMAFMEALIASGVNVKWVRELYGKLDDIEWGPPL